MVSPQWPYWSLILKNIVNRSLARPPNLEQIFYAWFRRPCITGDWNFQLSTLVRGDWSMIDQRLVSRPDAELNKLARLGEHLSSPIEVVIGQFVPTGVTYILLCELSSFALLFSSAVRGERFRFRFFCTCHWIVACVQFWQDLGKTPISGLFLKPIPTEYFPLDLLSFSRENTPRLQKWQCTWVITMSAYTVLLFKRLLPALPDPHDPGWQWIAIEGLTSWGSSFMILIHRLPLRHFSLTYPNPLIAHECHRTSFQGESQG